MTTNSQPSVSEFAQSDGDADADANADADMLSQYLPKGTLSKPIDEYDRGSCIVESAHWMGNSAGVRRMYPTDTEADRAVARLAVDAFVTHTIAILDDDVPEKDQFDPPAVAYVADVSADVAASADRYRTHDGREYVRVDGHDANTDANAEGVEQ